MSSNFPIPPFASQAATAPSPLGPNQTRQSEDRYRPSQDGRVHHNAAVGPQHEDPYCPTLKLSRIIRPALFPSALPQSLAESDEEPEEQLVPLQSGTFVTISLGETFNALLVLSNTSSGPISKPSVSLEIQTNTVRVDIGRREWEELEVQREEEMHVNWEMKELGMTLLNVTLRYETQEGVKELIKYYKFNVIAPFSIKTKTHLPTQPNMLLSLTDREKVYLEVHIQNVTSDQIAFSKIGVVSVPTLQVIKIIEGEDKDAISRAIEEDQDPSSLATNPSCDFPIIIPPGSICHRLFILHPSARPEFPKSSLFPPRHPPGQVLALGRLDLAWTSVLGDKGQLLTAVLTRRSPPLGYNSLAPPPRPTTMAKPLPNASLVRQSSTSSVYSSPRLRTGPSSSALRTDVPMLTRLTGPSEHSATPAEVDVDLDLVVVNHETNYPELMDENTIKFRLAARRKPVSDNPAENVLHLAVQYITHIYEEDEGDRSTSPQPPIPGNPSPAVSRTVSPMPYHVPHGQSLLSPRPRSTTPVSSLARRDSGTTRLGMSPTPELTDLAPVDRFPPPPVLPMLGPEPSTSLLDGEVIFSGSTLARLSPIQLRPLEIPHPHRDESPRTSIDGQPVMPPPPPSAERSSGYEGFSEFELQFVPIREGRAKLAGLRVLQLYDPKQWSASGRVLREWVTVGDVWIEG